MSFLFGSPPKPKDPERPAPPVSVAAVEVQAAKRNESRDLLRRKGIGATVIAGGNPGLTVGKELLGGGR